MVKISGFTYLRNAFEFGYPFEASIKSLLPIVDELVVVVGDSKDGSREAVEKIGDNKIKIIDSIWDEEIRSNGKIFAQQSNIGVRNISGDWCFHLQVDEVIHESARDNILNFIKLANKSDEIDGLILPFYHFWGDYDHIRHTRATHRFETRLFKNNRNIFSYRDSQGFRKYKSFENYSAGEEGMKLNVLKTDIPVYHYSYARNPRLLKKKSNYFHRFWHNDEWINKNTDNREFDFNEVDKLDLFTGSHHVYMKEIIESKDWDFRYDPSKSIMSLNDKILYNIERVTNFRLFEYRNYKVRQIQ
jgi:glycosyltransferase involved in cell wall biosynthesis